MSGFDFDAFVSHASEDKTEFVEPLAVELRKLGLKVWFDKFALRVGDSLHDSIEKGLASSRYGIVVFSPNFLAKNWPKAELNGLFARDIDGQKVILPIRHNISSAEIKKTLPILADRFALRSADGIEQVARSLVEVIRPELLEIDVKKATAFDAGKSFIDEARKKYPGYDFTLCSGTVNGLNLPKANFGVTSGNHRIEIRISDLSLIGRPPGGRVTFFGEGAKKAIEFQRTGKPQTWNPGEFVLEGWNVPLMPSNVETGTLMSTGQNLSRIPPRHMRVETNTSPPVIFPTMEMRPVRAGTQEAEVILSDPEVPLKIHIVFSFDLSKKVDFTLSWQFSGYKASECKKMIEAINGIRNGSVIRIINIRLDKQILESAASVVLEDDPFDDMVCRTVSLASQIEQEFLVSLRMPSTISERDNESLFHFDCLLNRREYGNTTNTTVKMVKLEGEAGTLQEAFVKGESSVIALQEPTNYPGYFPLFGERINTPSWVVSTEFVVAKEGVDSIVFTEALPGTQFEIPIEPKGPTFLRWKNT